SNRTGTDQRFLNLCDTLSRYADQGAEAWKPKVMWVNMFKTTVPPRTTFSWPSDWPAMPPANDTHGQMATVCISLSDSASTTTNNLIATDKKSRKRMYNAGIKAGDDRWWVINFWGFSLPGEIDLESDASFYPPLAKG